MDGLTIGKVARGAGLAIDTARYYEREGLLLEPARTATGYRRYSSDAVARLRFFRQAKDLGFSLFYCLIFCSGLAVLAPGATHAQDQKVTHVAKVDPDGVQRVRLEGGGYFFKPGHIVVKVNMPVELLASRESGITPHDLVLKAPEAGIAFEVELAAEPKKIAFTPTAVGKYPFYCSKKLLFFASHRERGMEGVLEVIP